MVSQSIVNLLYLIAAVLFIIDLKWMSKPRTAVRGNIVGAIGMALAIIATLLGQQNDWIYIGTGLIVGSICGTWAALKIKMTAMPEMVALFNGFGGIASALVAGVALLSAYHGLSSFNHTMELTAIIATVASGIIGSITFFGSYVAFGKLAELLGPVRKLKPWQKFLRYCVPVGLVILGTIYVVLAKGKLWATVTAISTIAISIILLLKKERFTGMDFLKGLVALISLALGILLILKPNDLSLYWALVGISGILGVLLTWSIGGADMPVVISLLNSYSGLAAAATGFVINNTSLIISGSLVGASGVILTSIMCKAMNRSLLNVLFGTLGPSSTTPKEDEVYKTVKAASAEEIAMLLDGARRVIIVPGYGMAVAQAQHAVRDLANLLESKGAQVEFAIHPVAGRMPGHMNVLLAEADVPYTKLKEMDEINPEMEQIDVAIVIGANDVVNPLAQMNSNSPIAGMPIIEVHRAKHVVVIKRSLAPGFAGVPNPLFAAPNTLMFFEDGKKAVIDIIAALKEN